MLTNQNKPHTGGDIVREYLKKRREEKGYTMQELADKLNISRQYYQMIESGERQRKMDITLIAGISAALDLSAENIISEENKLTET